MIVSYISLIVFYNGYFKLEIDLNLIFVALGNSTEAGIWFYSPQIDSDLIITHKIQSAAFTCIVHQSRLSNVLHISKPTNSLYPDDVRLILCR